MVATTRRPLLAVAASCLVGGRAWGQAGRPTRILVGFAAGGGNDVIARILAQRLSEGPLAPVLVENRTDASGLIAADVLAKSAPAATTHMAAEPFLVSAGIRMTHVSYRGEAPAIVDVIAGQVPLLFANVSAR